MTKTSALLGFFMIAILANSTAYAQTGEQIFQECVEKIRIMQNRCVTHMESVTTECIRRIDVLLAEGKREEARLVASRGIDAIRLSARKCITNMTEVCQRYVARLREIGANSLADRLETICTEARRSVVNRANELIARIRSKFQ